MKRGLGLLAVLALACGKGTTSSNNYLSRDQMLDPETCKQCHVDHFNEWSGSMHAYASDDPVFMAMNKRGQRETNGTLGSFCVSCHAPMAVREGATTDGQNLATVPQKLKGVTCFFCHSVDRVDDTHNDPLHLSADLVMRGGFQNPVANTAHAAGYSVLHDGTRLESATMCGSCHDIVTPQHASLERTYAEWQTSVFAHAPGGQTCGQCHMHQSDKPKPIAQNVPGVFARFEHEHTFPAVDVALATWPNADVQKQEIQTLLDDEIQGALCVTSRGGGSAIRVILDNVAAGHGFPSGAAQDRRFWIEVTAYQGANVIYKSGVVPDGQSPTTVMNDPDLWLLRDCIFDTGGKQVSMFWQAASYEGNELPVQVTSDQTDPRYYQSHIVQSFPRGLATFAGTPDKVTMRLRLQPMGIDVLDDLASSGDLDPSVKAAMPTWTVATNKIPDWTPAAATARYMEDGIPVTCTTSQDAMFVAADKVQATDHMRCKP